LRFFFLKRSKSEIDSFIRAIDEVRLNIVTCKICGGISDTEICSICGDSLRDHSTICVVENAKDVLTLESASKFQGLYHVLMGVISPLDGIGPEELNIRPLVQRCQSPNVVEVVLALNPSIEGDATSLYLSGLIKPLNTKVTRIAHGLPVGSDLDFIDSATIIKSFEGRVML
jgi:recombination protein RecR